MNVPKRFEKRPPGCPDAASETPGYHSRDFRFDRSLTTKIKGEIIDIECYLEFHPIIYRSFPPTTVPLTGMPRHHVFTRAWDKIVTPADLFPNLLVHPTTIAYSGPYYIWDNGSWTLCGLGDPLNWHPRDVLEVSDPVELHQARVFPTFTIGSGSVYPHPGNVAVQRPQADKHFGESTKPVLYEFCPYPRPTPIYDVRIPWVNCPAPPPADLEWAQPFDPTPKKIRCRICGAVSGHRYKTRQKDRQEKVHEIRIKVDPRAFLCDRIECEEARNLSSNPAKTEEDFYYALGRNVGFDLLPWIRRKPEKEDPNQRIHFQAEQHTHYLPSLRGKRTRQTIQQDQYDETPRNFRDDSISISDDELVPDDRVIELGAQAPDDVVKASKRILVDRENERDARLKALKSLQECYYASAKKKRTEKNLQDLPPEKLPEDYIDRNYHSAVAGDVTVDEANKVNRSGWTHRIFFDPTAPQTHSGKYDHITREGANSYLRSWILFVDSRGKLNTVKHTEEFRRFQACYRIQFEGQTVKEAADTLGWSEDYMSEILENWRKDVATQRSNGLFSLAGLESLQKQPEKFAEILSKGGLYVLVPAEPGAPGRFDIKAYRLRDSVPLTGLTGLKDGLSEAQDIERVRQRVLREDFTHIEAEPRMKRSKRACDEKKREAEVLRTAQFNAAEVHDFGPPGDFGRRLKTAIEETRADGDGGD